MNWFIGFVFAMIALFGLFLASRAVDGAMYTFGMLLCLFAVGFLFTIIHRLTDPKRTKSHG